MRYLTNLAFQDEKYGFVILMCSFCFCVLTSLLTFWSQLLSMIICRPDHYPLSIVDP